MRRFTRTVGKANAIQLAWKRHGGDIKTDDYLAKLSGVLDPNRVPTIPFSTRLGPVPVRVPTCIFISFLFYSWIRIGMRTNPASVGSIGDREIKKFSDFPPPHLVQPSPLPLVSILQAQEQKVAFLRLASKTKVESFGVLLLGQSCRPHPHLHPLQLFEGQARPAQPQLLAP